MAYVIIVDDDEDFASAAATVLDAAGYEVSVELSTGAGLKSMEKRRPDLAILDVMFPEDSVAGFELARQMHSHSETLKDVPVLMLTAVNTRFPLGFSPDDIDDTWLPVTEFLEKPIDFDELCKKVASMLAAGKKG